MQELGRSGYRDDFARTRLPPRELWPDFRFTLPELQYPQRLNAAAELLDRQVAAGAGANIAIHSVARNLTYSDLLAHSNRIAHVLTDDLGLVPGARVLLHGANTWELFAAWYGCLKAGGIAVATMPLLRAGELAVIAETAQVSHALYDARFAEAVEGAMAQAPVLKHALAWGPGGELENRMAAKPAAFDNCDTAADDVALLAFTSGTTGKPKACAHFHRSVLAMADSFARHVLTPQPGEIYAGTPPLAFTFGLGAFLVFPARFGLGVALPARPGFEALAETVQQFRATTLFTAPTGYRALTGLWDQYDLSSVAKAVSAGEHLPEATWRAFRDKTGIELIDGIGATELIHIFISAAGEAIRPGATGKPVPGYEAEVWDAAGNPANPGETGRLAVRGPTGCLYLADERQKTYVRKGWNITGDLYRKDEDGYFHYVSRADDLIVSSGYNIAGPEVEQALLTHPAVAECAVTGAPDETRGTIVKAWVVAKPGETPGPELAKALQEHVKQAIAPYKYPRAVEFLDALPKTQTGKIQRFRLRDEG
ncbi:MAG: AMP-binding protein [Maricaulaceae bacterium]|nr:AMP-binding protein [Maricaulaceae bacterium]